VAADPLAPRTVYLQPAQCLKVWPPETRIDVTIDAELPDVFGAALGEVVMAGFTTGQAPAGSAGPGLCPPGGGAGDGGAGDAGGSADGGGMPPDAGAAEDAAADAGVD
jgi:hypothetical protein